MSVPGANKSKYYIQVGADGGLAFTEDQHCKNCYVAEVSDAPGGAHEVVVRKQGNNPFESEEIKTALPGIQHRMIEFSSTGPRAYPENHLCPKGTKCYKASIQGGPADGVYTTTVRAPPAPAAPAAPATSASRWPQTQMNAQQAAAMAAVEQANGRKRIVPVATAKPWWQFGNKKQNMTMQNNPMRSQGGKGRRKTRRVRRRGL